MSIVEIADQAGCSPIGVRATIGRFIVGDTYSDPVTSGKITALSGNATIYHHLGIIPENGTLIGAYMYCATPGADGSQMDILRCTSGTYAISGVAMIRAVSGAGLTSNSTFTCVLSSGTNLAVNKGDSVFWKIKTVTSETLKLPAVQATFQL